MNYKQILKDLDIIENNINEFCDCDYPEVQPCMDIVEFSKLVEDTTEKQRGKQKESSLFKEMFNNNDYYENLSIYINQMQRNLTRQMEKDGVYYDANKTMRENLKEIKKLIDILKADYQILLKEDRGRYFKRNTQILDNISNIVKRLNVCEKKITTMLVHNSIITTNVILKNFKNLFTFFNNSIRVAKSRQDELLLVEIAGLSDLIVSNIKPVLQGKSLNAKELIYHSLIYEFRRLKNIAIN